MWNYLARAGVTAAGLPFIKDLNKHEVYVDRIKRDFRMPDYYDAWQLYNSDPAYWERYYNPPPSAVEAKDTFVRDSAAQTGIPSRNNVFEYGYPESDLRPSSTEGNSLGRASGSGPSLADRFGDWIASRASIAPGPDKVDEELAAGPSGSARPGDVRRLTRMPPTGR
ncbi:hypothetical protein ACFKHW_09470 [Bradyrhizobium lupini]|uniref:hypothetical protein n=1 Tax=Rhizobium lupini TaxID=136996 RepID=UPI00366C0A22